MTESGIGKLKIIDSELKKIWIQTQKKIKQIESEHPDFKKQYAEEYERYVFMQQYYSLVSLAQGLLEKFIDASDSNLVEELK